MTIPTLITNNQEKGWDVSASTFEAKFGQALKVMNTQNTLAGLNTTENFVAELQRHMKINKVCDNTKLTECFTSEINGAKIVIDVTDESTWNNDSSKPAQTNILKTAKELGQKTWGTKTMGLQFANGVSAIVAYNPKCSSDPFNVDAVKVTGNKHKITFDTDCVAMVYDTQSYKNPNTLNKDIRLSLGTTVGDEGCVFKIGDTCINKVLPSVTSISKSECEGLKTTHGILTCGVESDNWAAAVQACEGVDKLASYEDFHKMGAYLYLSGYNGDRAAAISLPERPLSGWWVNTEASDGIYAGGLLLWGDAIRNEWTYDRSTASRLHPDLAYGHPQTMVLCKK